MTKVTLHIETLIRQAPPGMPMVHVPSPHGSIPIKLNYQYFSLNQAGVAWEAVQRARNIAAYIPGDIPNPQAELIILLPQAELSCAEAAHLKKWSFADGKKRDAPWPS